MSKKHMLLMLACCLIPVGLIVAISALAIPVTGFVSIIIGLMCPAMMIFMLLGMRGDHTGLHEHHPAALAADKRQIGSSVDQPSH